MTNEQQRYVVMIQCNLGCDTANDYEPRLAQQLEFTDVDEAIRVSNQMRDTTHNSWVDFKKED